MAYAGLRRLNDIHRGAQQLERAELRFAGATWYASYRFIVDSSVVGYDGARNVRDEERSVWQTKPEREQKEEREQSRWGFRRMTVRDWLPIVGALLITVVIAAGTWGFTWQQGSLEGATMPNGQKYEDWLKSKDRKEDG